MLDNHTEREGSMSAQSQGEPMIRSIGIIPVCDTPRAKEEVKARAYGAAVFLACAERRFMPGLHDLEKDQAVCS